MFVLETRCPSYKVNNIQTLQKKITFILRVRLSVLVLFIRPSVHTDWHKGTKGRDKREMYYEETQNRVYSHFMIVLVKVKGKCRNVCIDNILISARECCTKFCEEVYPLLTPLIFYKTKYEKPETPPG